jgi:hypothetical protein
MVPSALNNPRSMSLKSLLQSYADAAAQAGYRAWVNAPDAPGQVSELFCLIHVDEAQRNYIVHGMCPHELLAALGDPASESDLILL